MLPFPRRLLLTGCVAPLLGAAAAVPPVGTQRRHGTVGRGASGLHSRALAKGLFYGAAIDPNVLRTDAAYMAHVPVECGMVAGETGFKWAELRPRQDRFAFERADMLLSYAARHGLRARGHSLIWHEAVPEWLTAALTPRTAEKLLTSHVHEVVGHFRRRLVHWDVVNEVLAPEDQQPHGLRDSLWYRALGPRYIDLAFQRCAAADPHALRVINEFGLEYAIPWQEKRRGAMLDLLSDLKARNIPVQALGMQAHLDAGEPALDQKVLAKFCEDVASMGLKILITEMDVRDDKLPADIRRRDAAVAAHGRAFLDAMLVNPAVIGVLTWGLSDRRSWLNEKMPRPDRLPQRPLPLDADLRRKALWTAMAGAFDTARPRSA